jgi:hypothetical protein
LTNVPLLDLLNAIEWDAILLRFWFHPGARLHMCQYVGTGNGGFQVSQARVSGSGSGSIYDGMSVDYVRSSVVASEAPVERLVAGGHFC